MLTDKQITIEKFNLKEGDTIMLGKRRGNCLVKIKRITDKSIVVEDSAIKLRFKTIVKDNFTDIEKNLGMVVEEE